MVNSICEYCEKPIRWFELSSSLYEHSFVGGEHHGLGCRYIMRILGTLMMIPIRLIQIIIGLIIYPFIIFKRVFITKESCGGF